MFLNLFLGCRINQGVGSKSPASEKFVKILEDFRMTNDCDSVQIVFSWFFEVSECSSFFKTSWARIFILTLFHTSKYFDPTTGTYLEKRTVSWSVELHMSRFCSVTGTIFCNDEGTVLERFLRLLNELVELLLPKEPNRL